MLGYVGDHLKLLKIHLPPFTNCYEVVSTELTSVTVYPNPVGHCHTNTPSTIDIQRHIPTLLDVPFIEPKIFNLDTHQNIGYSIGFLPVDYSNRSRTMDIYIENIIVFYIFFYFYSPTTINRSFLADHISIFNQ